MTIAARIAALALTGTLALTGCGATSGTGGASSAASATSTAAASAGTVAFAPPAPGEKVTDLDGFFEASTAGAAAIKTATVRSTSPGLTLSGAMDQSDLSNIKFRYTTELAGQKVEFIYVNGTAYMKLAAGGKYQKASLPIDPNSFSSVKMTEEWRSTVTSVTYVGKETVDGVDTDHYVMEARQSSDANAQTAQLHAWVDSQFRVIKSGVGQLEIVYSNINEPVTIEAPPADQVNE